MNWTHDNRRGFTIVEMIIVALLGSLLVAAAYEVLRTHQRAYTMQTAEVQGQQSIRAAMGVLSSELRELSRTGEDVIEPAEDSLVVRAQRAFGLVCDTTPDGSPVYVKRVGRWFEDGDSIFVFADNDEDIASDDTTLTAVITSIDTTSNECSGMGVDTVQRMFAPALEAAAAAGDTVKPGAPVRSFTSYTYTLVTTSGDSYLARRDAGGLETVLVGPLKSGGLAFAYYDSVGTTTTDPSEIYQIEITVHYESEVVGEDGYALADSIKTRVNLRN